MPDTHPYETVVRFKYRLPKDLASGEAEPTLLARGIENLIIDAANRAISRNGGTAVTAKWSTSSDPSDPPAV